MSPEVPECTSSEESEQSDAKQRMGADSQDLRRTKQTSSRFRNWTGSLSKLRNQAAILAGINAQGGEDAARAAGAITGTLGPVEPMAQRRVEQQEQLTRRKMDAIQRTKEHLPSPDNRSVSKSRDQEEGKEEDAKVLKLMIDEYLDHHPGVSEPLNEAFGRVTDVLDAMIKEYLSKHPGQQEPRGEGIDPKIKMLEFMMADFVARLPASTDSKQRKHRHERGSSFRTAIDQYHSRVTKNGEPRREHSCGPVPDGYVSVSRGGQKKVRFELNPDELQSDLQRHIEPPAQHVAKKIGRQKPGSYSSGPRLCHERVTSERTIHEEATDGYTDCLTRSEMMHLYKEFYQERAPQQTPSFFDGMKSLKDKVLKKINEPKDRLFICLSVHHRGRPFYHWSLVCGNKNRQWEAPEHAKEYIVRKRFAQGQGLSDSNRVLQVYDNSRGPVGVENSKLVLICIDEVNDRNNVDKLIKLARLPTVQAVSENPSWWVRRVLDYLIRKSAIPDEERIIRDWKLIEDVA
jgi:hypothetical protein